MGLVKEALIFFFLKTGLEGPGFCFINHADEQLQGGPSGRGNQIEQPSKSTEKTLAKAKKRDPVLPASTSPSMKIC
jgi:hypothetical protein